MSRKMSSRSASLALLAVCIVGCCIANPTASPGSPAPHIIFIMVDDMGFHDIQYRTDTDIHTPTLNELATQNGVRLENYYTGPSCGPTRAQFLSGKYTINLGLQDSNLDACTNEELNATLDTVADKLKPYGYATHLIGKWHAGFSTIDHFPTHRGFDTFRGFLLSHSANHFTRKSRYGQGTPENQLYYDYHDDDGTNIVSPYKGDDRDAQNDKLYSTRAFTDRAVNLIDNHDPNEPMFMYLAYQAPHTPIQTEDNTYDGLYSGITPPDRRAVASMISSIDAGVAEVLAALKNNIRDQATQESMYDNTYIIFTSDNGGSAGAGSSSFPLRGGKGSYYEGGIRNIGFVHSKLLNAPDNLQTDSLVHVTDWMPTFMHIASSGSADLANLNIDGINQFSTLTSGGKSRYEILHNIRRRQNNGRNKYDTSIPSAMVKEFEVDEETNGVVTGNKIYKKFKILTGRQEGAQILPNPTISYTQWDSERAKKTQTERGVRLFNLSDDPKEETNLVCDLCTPDTETSDIYSDLLSTLKAYEQNAVNPITTIDYGEKGSGVCNPRFNGGYYNHFM